MQTTNEAPSDKTEEVQKDDKVLHAGKHKESTRSDAAEVLEEDEKTESAAEASSP